MPVSLTCTGCKCVLTVRDDLAGKKVKCPRCALALVVPEATEEAEFAAVEVIPDDRVSDEPPDKPRSRPRRDDPDEEDRPRGRVREEDEEDRGRRRRRDREEDEEDRGRRRRDRDEEEDDRPVRRSKYKPCPRCGEEDPRKVMWTAWGSFYGPAMFTHVRCRDCGYCYNGKTGGSNLIPAVIFVAVPLIGILGILGGLAYVVFLRGYFGK
jgi:hypothetical protein